MEHDELDASSKLGKVKKLAKMKNVMVMTCMTQCLSIMATMNAISNVQDETGWTTGSVYQLFDNLNHKYNPNDKLLRVQMIKMLHEIKPKNGEDPKVMYKKIKALKVKYQGQAKILDSDIIVMRGQCYRKNHTQKSNNIFECCMENQIWWRSSNTGRRRQSCVDEHGIQRKM